MRILLLAGVASLAMAAAPAFAAPLNIAINGQLWSWKTNQTFTQQSQTINHAGHIYGHSPEAIQIGVNAALFDSHTNQTIDQNQTVNGPNRGYAVGTQAVQVGANVAVGTSHFDQSVTQSQEVNDNGHGGVTAVQVGANVAVSSAGGSQTINQSQTVNE
ncbi:MAG TPA: hypothetical protein VHB23_12015 [Devosiaceae bacterium]|nr:hypothetical protein [Devosiaceae bacterium]